MFNNKNNPFESGKSSSIDVEGVILDAELLLKYRFLERAISTLEKAIAAYPKNIELREKLLEIFSDYNMPEKAADQAVSLSQLYMESGDLERANENLAKAKGFNPNLNVNLFPGQTEVPRMQMLMPMPMAIPQPLSNQLYRPIQRIPRPQARLQQTTAQTSPQKEQVAKVLTGDLATISIFDVIQMVENSRITGVLQITSTNIQGRIYFNYGQIADAQVGELRSNEAFRSFVELEEGRFELEKSPVEFKQNVNAPNNTNLILDVLREVDEAKRDQMMG
jgi:tetratricopeptide (TPR) repeat protein